MKTKSLLITCLSAAMITSVLVGCNKNVTPTGVTLDVATKTLKTGESYQLKATVTPENATNKNVTWESTDNKILTVTDGNVKALKEGTADVTVKTVEGGKTATCKFTIEYVPQLENLAVVAPVLRNESFVSFDNNKAEKENKREEFVDREQDYVVGTDNAIKVKPEFEVVDTTTLKSVSQDYWTYDYKFNVQLKSGDSYVAAPAADYTVDAKKCEIKFNQSALNNYYKIDVYPGGLNAEKEAQSKYHAVQEVKVEEGYNVYSADELAYIDARHGNNHDEAHGGDVLDNNWKDQWDAFKTAKGFDKNFKPKALHLQTKITITKDNIPANFIYSAEDLKSADDPDSIGTLKDTMFIYDRWDDGEFTFNGNYFTVDYSAIPFVNRFNGEKTAATGDRNSHSALFRIGRGHQTIENVNFIGNSKNATKDEEKKYSGGLMLIKCGMLIQKFEFTNNISIQTYIQVMNDDLRNVKEDFEEEMDPSRTISTEPYPNTITNTKGFDNYNCFIYNWGERVYVKKSTYSGCGGPIIIQDHRGTDATDHPCEKIDETGYTILESPSRTVVDNCNLENYVSGAEAWFQQMKVTGLVSQIMAMSDMFYPNGLSYVVDENKNPTIASQGGGKKMFNFVVVNKSSSAEGLTQIPVCGEVKFIDAAGNETFNYAEPDSVSYYYLNQMQTALTALSKSDVTTFTTIATALGYTDPNPLVNAEAMKADMLQLSALKHTMIRQINAAGAPVFQSGGENYAYYDGQNQYLQSVNNAVPGMTKTDPLAASDDFFAKAGNHVGLYFMGMMLIFGLKKVTTI